MLDLVGVPLFANLSRVDIARLVPEFDERSLTSGELLFQQGDPADALYIVRDGTLRAELDSPAGVAILELLGPGRVIGEVALLSGEPRTAAIRAVTATTLWRLSRQKLDDLIGRYPSFAAYFGRLVSQRLVNVNEHLRATRESLADLSAIFWDGLSAQARALLLEAAPLSALTPPLAQALLGENSQPLLHELERAGVLQPDGHERLLIRPAVGRLAARLARQNLGEGGYRAAASSLAARCCEAGAYESAVEALIEGEDYAAALAVLAEHGDQLLARSNGDRLLVLIKRISAVDEPPPEVRRLQVRAQALSASRSGGEGVVDADPLAAASGAAVPALGAREEVLRPVKAEQGHRPLWWAFGAGLLALVGGLTWWGGTRAGLQAPLVQLLTIIACATLFWVLDVAPEFLVALLVCGVAVLVGTVPITVAFSGFSSSSFVLLFVIFALVALVTRSGLPFRVALVGLRLVPPTYRGQLWALAVSGLLVTPLIPGSSGRLTLVSPLVLAIKDTLHLVDRGRPSAGLALAASLGFGQLSFLFLNGSGTTLLIASLLPAPQAAALTWTGWFGAALPLGIIYFVGGVLVTQWCFGPREALRVDLRVIEAQLRTLGTVTRQEVLGLIGLALLLLAFVLQPWHHLDPAWLGLVILAVLAVVGADRAMFKELDYQYLLYFASFQSIATMIRTTGLDALLLSSLQPGLALLPASPYILLIGFTIISYLVALLPGFPAQPVLLLSTVPLAADLGYDPLVFGLIILLTSTPILIPRLSALHLLFWNTTEQRAFTDSQAREYALYRAALMVAAVLAAIPLWQATRLVP